LLRFFGQKFSEAPRQRGVHNEEAIQRRMVAILGKADCGTVAETANKRWLSEQPTYS